MIAWDHRLTTDHLMSSAKLSNCDSHLVKRLAIRFDRDERWVVTRPFFPGGENRILNVARRVSQLSDPQAEIVLARIRTDFYSRHKQLDSVLLENFDHAASIVPELSNLSAAQKLLVGSYFTMEYSFASTALFNPSIVEHPDQSGLEGDSLSFIMSLRATGEGHVSSIVFRTGVIGANHAIDFDPLSKHRNRMRLSPDRTYVKQLFRRKLHDLVVDDTAIELVMRRLGHTFTLIELEHAIEQAHDENPDMFWLSETTDSMDWFAQKTIGSIYLIMRTSPKWLSFHNLTMTRWELKTCGW